MDPPIINDWWLQYDYKPLAAWLKRVVDKTADNSVLIIAGPYTSGKTTIENFIKTKIGNVKRIPNKVWLGTDQSRTDSGQLVNLYIEIDSGPVNELAIRLATKLYHYCGKLKNSKKPPLIIPIHLKDIKDYMFPAYMQNYDITILELLEIPNRVRNSKYKANAELTYWISGLHETKKTCIAFMCVYFYRTELSVLPKDVVRLIAKTLFNIVKSEALFGSYYYRNLQLNKK
jgi:hypothetical protein